MKIVVLDAARTNPGDLSWEGVEKIGELTVYPSTPPEKVVDRSRGADILLSNKIKFTPKVFAQLPDLKLICQLATGYDNVDIMEARKAGVTVCNAVGYSTDSVAQHVFALLLNQTNQVASHNQWAQRGGWYTSEWSHTLNTLEEVAGKTMGIYGFGKIGQRVGELAHAFKMNVIAHHKHPERDARPWVSFVSLEELFERSNVISLHAPLSIANKHIVNHTMLARMKKDAHLINTGRGGLIDDEALKIHLQNHPKTLASLDVLAVEPPEADHPLIGLSNCIITPHNAWATLQARKRLIDIVAEISDALSTVLHRM